MRWITGYVVLAMMLSTGAALAQTAAERAACKADFVKLCPGVKPGGGRPMTCLAQHKDKLSPACLKVVTAHEK